MPESLSSELLGFAPTARVLLVNADDFGMHTAINRAVLNALDHGIARSTSLMATCPGSSDAVAVLRRRPDISFGVHLTLVRDSSADDWKPLTPGHEIGSLVDADGRFPRWADAGDLLDTARVDEVATEFRAQLAAVLDAGLRPTHLDFHSLADGGRRDIFDAAADLAIEHGLALRVWLEPNRSRARTAGLPVVDHPFLDSFSIDPDAKPDHYEALLRALPAGLTEWAVHPATGDAAASADPHDRDVRVTDHQFLTSPRAAALIAEEGIELIDYRAIRAAWRSHRAALS